MGEFKDWDAAPAPKPPPKKPGRKRKPLEVAIPEPVVEHDDDEAVEEDTVEVGGMPTPVVSDDDETIAGRRACEYGTGATADTARRIARDIVAEYHDLCERRPNYKTFVYRMARAEADSHNVETRISALDRLPKLKKEDLQQLKLLQERLETLRKQSDECLDEIGETPHEQRLREVEDACMSNLYVRYKHEIDAMRSRGMKPGDFTPEAKQLAEAKGLDLSRYRDDTLEPLPDEVRNQVLIGIETAYPESKAEKETE